MPKQPRILLFDHSPHLRGEWDYEKNVGIDPETLSYGSKRMASWECTNGHRWDAVIYSRHRHGCPFCSGRMAEIGVSDLGTTNPELVDELVDPTDAQKVTPRSGQKLWWKCEKHHKWLAPPYSRTRGVGCPYCRGMYAWRGESDLWTVNPGLASELVDPEIGYSLTRSGDTIVTWRCALLHEWKDSVNHRDQGRGCPTCSGKRLLVGFNDLKTTHPHVASELVDKNIALTVGKGSHLVTEWVCAAQHQWRSAVYHRASGKGCPKCSTNQTSEIESRLRRALSLRFNVLSEDHTYRLDVPYRKNKTMSVDIYLEVSSKKVVVEYDGAYFHRTGESQSRDFDKTRALLSNDYLVVRVREQSGELALPYLPIDHPRLYQISAPYSKDDKYMERVAEMIEEWLEKL